MSPPKWAAVVASRSYLMRMFVIYDNPSDYPDKFVVREHQVHRDSTHTASLQCTVFDTLDGARRSLPQGLYRLTRSPDDDPVIVEVWI